MPASVIFRLEEGIAYLEIAAPAADLALAVAELSGELERLQAEAQVRALVIEGGLELLTAGPPLASGPLDGLLGQIGCCDVPVLAVVSGTLTGTGLAIAFACHARIAQPAARLGFPEVRLGLLPPPATILKFTQLAGAQPALAAMSAGAMISAAQALTLGLIDEVAADAVGAATARAQEPGIRPKRADGDPPGPAFFAEFRSKSEAKARGQLAPRRIIDAVEAACTLPAPQALTQLREYFAQCREGPQHRALVHVNAAQREARLVPGLPQDTRPLPIRTAAVIGAGTMGGGIAMNFASAGIPVTLLEVSAEALERGMGIIRRNYEASVARGSLTAEGAAAALALVRGATEYTEVAQADIIIEAVFEDMKVKRAVFGRLDEVAAPRAILATNTSTLDIDAIASGTRRPGQVVGTHFFSPANIMKLLENVRGRATTAEVLATVMDLGRLLGKVTVLAGNADGFIGNHMLMFYGLEAEFLLEEGATPEQIDRVMEGFGFAMGPLAVRDLSGNDVGLMIRKTRTLPQGERWSPVLARMVEAGRLGQKAGKGFYRYEGRKRLPDAEAVALIEGVSSELGIQRREIPDEEILERLLHPLVNAGARLIESGIAQRASDVDVVWVNGYGFPAWRGGPMYWALHAGLDRVIQTTKRLAQAHGERWGPAPLLVRAAREGRWELG